MSEPTPEAVEELARELDDLLDIGKYAMGDAPTSRDYARVFLAAGHVDHGTYAAAAMARDAAEQMHDRAIAENDRLRAQVAGSRRVADEMDQRTNRSTDRVVDFWQRRLTAALDPESGS